MSETELRREVEKARRRFETHAFDLQREIGSIEADGGTAAYERGKSFAYGYAVSVLDAALAASKEEQNDA